MSTSNAFSVVILTLLPISVMSFMPYQKDLAVADVILSNRFACFTGNIEPFKPVEENEA